MDSKEAFNIGLDLPATDPEVVAGKPFRGVNVWPDLPMFRDVTLAYYDMVWALGLDLHRAIALDLGLRPDFFARHFSAAIGARVKRSLLLKRAHSRRCRLVVTAHETGEQSSEEV